MPTAVAVPRGSPLSPFCKREARAARRAGKGAPGCGQRRCFTGTREAMPCKGEAGFELGSSGGKAGVPRPRGGCTVRASEQEPRSASAGRSGRGSARRPVCSTDLARLAGRSSRSPSASKRRAPAPPFSAGNEHGRHRFPILTARRKPLHHVGRACTRVSLPGQEGRTRNAPRAFEFAGCRSPLHPPSEGWEMTPLAPQLVGNHGRCRPDLGKGSGARPLLSFPVREGRGEGGKERGGCARIRG